jgi:hypothetical protein
MGWASDSCYLFSQAGRATLEAMFEAVTVINSRVSRMSSVAEVTGFTRFNVSFDAPSSTQSKSLYANGNMQVRILVTLRGKDKDGKSVPLTPSIYHTVRLINYRTGEVLQGNWQVSDRPNQFWYAMSGSDAAPAPLESVEPDITVLEYWVSSSVVDTVHIGAAVILNDRIIRTNNTTVGDKHDSSVMLVAEAPVTYAIEDFKLERVRSEGRWSHEIFHCYLGLYPGGRQLRLVDWSAADDGHHHRLTRSVFEAYGGFIDNDYRWYVSCKLAAVKDKEVFLVLPPEKGERIDEVYYVKVNDRDGELSIVRGVGESFSSDTYVRKETFNFTAYDVYGTAHKLRVRPDFDKRPADFILERG